MSKISKNEAILFNYICNTSEWRISWSESLVEALPVFVEPNDLKKITNSKNFEDVDEAISHLQFLGLITHESDLSNDRHETYTDTFDNETSGTDGQWYNLVELRLTSLGIRMHLKVQGIEERPSEYFKDKVPVSNDREDEYYDD